VSAIGKLIARVCSNGVEFKRLGELGATYSGLTGKHKTDFSGGNARFVAYMNIYRNLGVDLRADDFVRIHDGEKQNLLRCGDVLFTGSSETPEDVGMSSVVLEEPMEPVYLNSFCFGYRLTDPTVLLPGFSKYVFRSDTVRRAIARSASGVTRFNISKERFLKVRIPVPPTEVQREIVKVLDSFAELQAELAAELEARRHQYQYYRDALFSPARNLQIRALGEVGTFTRGRRFTIKDFVESGVGCIHYGEIYTYYGLFATKTKSFLRPTLAAALRMAKTGDLVIAGTGENVDEVCKAVAWLGDDDVAVHDDCYIFRHSLNPKYAAYLFQSSIVNQQKVRYAAGAKMIRVSSDNLEKIRVPVPPLEEQQRIVAILDQFDVLLNDPSIGLPAELEARRQAYKYYRDRLLAFGEAA
jgi:type I restriction enzyme S subunit